MPMEACPLFAIPDHLPSVVTTSKVSPFSDMRVLQDVMSRFKAVQVDPAEFACLKAIVLFKSGKNTILLVFLDLIQQIHESLNVISMSLNLKTAENYQII